MKELLTGFQSFYICGEPITREAAIKHIQDNESVFTFAPCEPDNRSKEICTDGVNIWKE